MLGTKQVAAPSAPLVLCVRSGHDQGGTLGRMLSENPKPRAKSESRGPRRLIPDRQLSSLPARVTIHLVGAAAFLVTRSGKHRSEGLRGARCPARPGASQRAFPWAIELSQTPLRVGYSDSRPAEPAARHSPPTPQGGHKAGRLPPGPQRGGRLPPAPLRRR